MDVIVKAYDGEVQTVDASTVWVHQLAAGAKMGVERLGEVELPNRCIS
jgi:hypothetical protein